MSAALNPESLIHIEVVCLEFCDGLGLLYVLCKAGGCPWLWIQWYVSNMFHYFNGFTPNTVHRGWVPCNHSKNTKLNTDLINIASAQRNYIRKILEASQPRPNFLHLRAVSFGVPLSVWRSVTASDQLTCRNCFQSDIFIHQVINKLYIQSKCKCGSRIWSRGDPRFWGHNLLTKWNGVMWAQWSYVQLVARSFWVFNVQISILPHPRGLFSLISDTYFDIRNFLFYYLRNDMPEWSEAGNFLNLNYKK